MMGRKYREQANFFYEFRLDDMIPKGHLLRRINVFVTSVLGDLHEQLGPFYSAIGRPSIDPELLIRMLIVGYCFGLRSERKLCEEVKLHLAYRWFCRLDLNDAIPHHSTYSENRLNRFRERRSWTQLCHAPAMDGGRRLEVSMTPRPLVPLASLFADQPAPVHVRPERSGFRRPESEH